MLMDDLERQISARAEDAAARFQEPSGFRLDFSAASLAALDELVAEIAEFVAEVSPEQADGLVQDFGCYLFEVARRTLGGKYYWVQDLDQPVLTAGGPDATIALAGFTRVGRCLRGEAPEPLADFFADFASRVHAAQPGDDVLCV